MKKYSQEQIIRIAKKVIAEKSYKSLVADFFSKLKKIVSSEEELLADSAAMVKELQKLKAETEKVLHNIDTEDDDETPPIPTDLKPSKELAEVIGDKKTSATDATKKVWEYIQEHKLEDPNKKRDILCDDKLKKLFKKDTVVMFEIANIIKKHLS